MLAPYTPATAIDKYYTLGFPDQHSCDWRSLQICVCSQYTVPSTRRHPARPLSVPIRQSLEIKVTWAPSYATEDTTRWLIPQRAACILYAINSEPNRLPWTVFSTDGRRHRAQPVSSTILQPCVRVFHTKPFFSPVDIQHNQCPCRFFNPRRDTRYLVHVSWSQGYATEMLSGHVPGTWYAARTAAVGNAMPCLDRAGTTY